MCSNRSDACKTSDGFDRCFSQRNFPSRKKAGGVALHLSEKWYRIYGFDPENGPPTFEERQQRTHPEDRAKSQGAIDLAIAEKSGYEVEFRMLLPDGSR